MATHTEQQRVAVDRFASALHLLNSTAGDSFDGAADRALDAFRALLMAVDVPMIDLAAAIATALSNRASRAPVDDSIPDFTRE